MQLPQVVPEDQWRDALRALRAEEKSATRARDALAAARRRLPMVEIERDHVFEGPDGQARVVDLFDGRRQLLVYHFMFSELAEGWPNAGCIGCSMFADQVGNLAHFHARDTTFVFVSNGPLAQLEAYRRRMGWEIPWYSLAGNDFNADLGVHKRGGEGFGLSVFVRDGERVFRTYFTAARGVEALGSVWTFLDLTPLGRQEQWEDSPDGHPQTPPYTWWHRHDEYEETQR